MAVPALTRCQRAAVLGGAFLAWLFAGLEISLFVLVHRQMTLELLGTETPEAVVTRWFAWYQAAFLFGAAAGGWVFGALGDRAGRTRALAASVLCYSLGALACHECTSAEGMLALRFLACLGVGGVWPNAVALVAEAWPDASRPLTAGLLGAAANVGFVLLGVIGYYHPITQDAWRWTFLVGASPAFLGLVILAAVPESPRWLAARVTVAGGGTSRAPVSEVLRPPLLSRTVLGVLLGAIPVVGSAANANWLVPWSDAAQHRVTAAAVGGAATVKPPPDPRTKAKTQITRSGGAVLGSLLGGLIAGAVVLSAGFLLDQFGGDYGRVGFWTGMIYAAGMLVIWLVPRGATGRLED